MLISDREEVVFIDSHEISYLNKSVRRWIGYDQGRIENGNLLLWIQKYVNDHNLKSGRKWFSKELNNQAFECSGHFLGVRIFGDENEQPIIKRCETTIALDTVFSGKEINVLVDSTDKVSIVLDEQTYEIQLTDQGSQFIVFSGDALKFFLPPEVDDDWSALISPSMDYKAFINNERLFNSSLPLNEIFNESINRLDLSKTNLNVVQVFECQGQFMIFKRRQLDPKREEIQIYSTEYLDRLIDHLFEIKSTLSESSYIESNPILDFHNIISQSITMMHIKELLGRVSVTNASVLLLGESGTGKTMIAQEIHKKSKRSLKPFIVINCAAIPENLIESELFGYEEGSFTGARRTGKKGYFELANGGTIFLDEIGELPLSSQGRLLEVLQNQSFYRIGGNKKVEVDVRIIAATNQDIEKYVEDKKFRRDLYYRLNVFPINVPPLRERIEDIDLLSKKILPRICSRLEIEPLVLSDEAIQKLKRHQWPGNIRELENVLEQASILCEGRVIKERHLLMKKNDEQSLDLKSQLEDFEKKLIVNVLASTGFNKLKTAKILDIGRTTLFEKMKKYDIEG